MDFRLKFIIPLILGILLIVACSPESEFNGTTAPVRSEENPVPTKEVTPPPAVTETPVLEIPAVAAGIAHLANLLAIAEADIDVVELEGVEWPDSCLGDAQPDEICLQVITPGYRIVLRAAGEEYVYHTDESGRILRLISGSVGFPVKPGVDINKPKALIAAMRFLSESSGIPISEMRLVSMEQVEWQDSCLGLGRADESCARTIVPGWNIQIESAGQIYELHSDLSGDIIRLK